jgi:hypothetical protein
MKTNPLKTKAAALVNQLEKQRAGQTLMLYKVVKTQQATPAILTAEPELKAAFVEHVVDLFARLGTPKGKKAKEWFRSNHVPNASAEIVRLLLRRELPLSDATLADLLEKLSGISFLSAVQFRDQLAQYLEKFSKKNTLSPRLRKCAGRYADVEAFRHVKPAEAKFWKEEWGLPRAADLKVAARIDKVLSR